MATTPSRVRNASSTVTGKRVDLETGAIQLNFADQKIYAASPSNSPVLMSQVIKDFNGTLAYDKGDLMILSGTLYRAAVDVPENTGFRTADWTPLANGARAAIGEPYPSSLITAGSLNVVDNNEISVGGGTAIIVDTTDPATIEVSQIEWTAFSFTVPQAALDSREPIFVGFSNSGTFTATQYSAFGPTQRRSTAVLGTVYSDDSGNISAVGEDATVGGQLGNSWLDKYFAEGGPRKVSGLEILGSPFDLSLSSQDGEIFAFNLNWQTNPTSPSEVTFAAIDPLTFDIIDRFGTVTVLNTTLVQPTVYDTGTGAPVAVPSGNATIQYLSYRLDGRYTVQLGQTAYPTFADASLALGKDSAEYIASPSNYGTVLLAAVLLGEGTLTTGDSSVAQVITALAVPGNPFLPPGQTDTSGFLDLAGTREMLGKLDMGGNSIVDAIADGGIYSDMVPSPEDRFFYRSPQSDNPGALAPTDPVYRRMLAFNTGDKRIFGYDGVGNSVILQHKTEAFDTSKAYLTGDQLLSAGNALLIANQNNGPGSYDASNWDPIAPEDYVTELPSASNTNVIQPGDTTTVNIGLKAIAAQVEPLLETESDTGTKLGGVLPTGVEFGLMEGNVFDRQQFAHSFTKAGQPASYDGANWILASSAAEATLGVAVVEKVIDANNIRIRSAGRLPGIDPSVVSGGVVTPGQFYYVSETPAGQLQLGPVQIGKWSNPVVYALTTTEFFVMPYRPHVERGAEPVGSPTLYPVSQQGHPFTKIGQVGYFDGSNWALGVNSSVSTAGDAVVGTIDDADNFTMQLTGSVVSIDPTVSDEGSFTTGAVYYLSPSTAGNLTNQPIAIGQPEAPILRALTATSGLLLLQRPMARVPNDVSMWTSTMQFREGDETVVMEGPSGQVTYRAMRDNIAVNPSVVRTGLDWRPVTARGERHITVTLGLAGDYTDLGTALEYFSWLTCYDESDMTVEVLDGTHSAVGTLILPRQNHLFKIKAQTPTGTFDAWSTTLRMPSGGTTKAGWDQARTDWEGSDMESSRAARAASMDTGNATSLPTIIEFDSSAVFQTVAEDKVIQFEDLWLRAATIQSNTIADGFGLRMTNCALSRFAAASWKATALRNVVELANYLEYDNEVGATSYIYSQANVNNSSFSHNKGTGFDLTRGAIRGQSNLFTGNVSGGAKVLSSLGNIGHWIAEGNGSFGVDITSSEIFIGTSVGAPAILCNGNIGTTREGLSIKGSNVTWEETISTEKPQMVGNAGNGITIDTSNFIGSPVRINWNAIHGAYIRSSTIRINSATSVPTDADENGGNGIMIDGVFLDMQGTTGAPTTCRRNEGNAGLWATQSNVNANKVNWGSPKVSAFDILVAYGSVVQAFDNQTLTNSTPALNGGLGTTSDDQVGCAVIGTTT